MISILLVPSLARLSSSDYMWYILRRTAQFSYVRSTQMRREDHDGSRTIASPEHHYVGPVTGEMTPGQTWEFCFEIHG